MNAVDVDNLVAVPSMDDDGMGHQRSTSNDYNDDVQRFSSSRDLPLGQTDDSQFANSNPNSPDERAPPEESDSPQYASSNYGYDNFANYPNSYGSSEFQTPGAFSSADLRHSGGGGSVDMDNNLQRPIMTDARMNRIALAEAAMREEMFKECTFRPKIKNLPSHYGPMKEASTPFQTRVVKWQKEKELAAKAKKEMISSGEKVECTFNPKINRNSDKAIKEIRGPEYSESANDRLYRNSGLYLQQRAQLIDESKEKQDEKIKADCTFRPELVTKRSEVHKSVMPKYATHATKAVQPDTDSDAGNRKNCTFTPKVNKIKPNMSSAKLYLSTNVVDRLTRPIGGGGVSEEKGADGAGAGGGSSGNLNQLFDNELSTHDRPVMDMASFMGNLQQQQQRPHSAGGRPQRSSSAPRGSKTSTMTPEEREERKRQFEMFLSRQQTVLKRKEDNVKQVCAAICLRHC